jgi:hypothetical protein
VFAVLLVLFGFIITLIVVAGIIIDHDQHAAVAPLPHSEYSISIQSCTVNQLGETEAVGTLTRLTQTGSFTVSAAFFNAMTGKYLGYGGGSVHDPEVPSSHTFSSIIPVPKGVPIRCTRTLAWDNPQPISLT